MHENETVRDLLQAALRKLEESGAVEAATEQNVPPSVTMPHPGHERFTMIERSSTPADRKPCYMEPDRPCVNSGACEMRGY